MAVPFGAGHDSLGPELADLRIALDGLQGFRWAMLGESAEADKPQYKLVLTPDEPCDNGIFLHVGQGDGGGSFLSFTVSRNGERAETLFSHFFAEPSIADYQRAIAAGLQRCIARETTLSRIGA